MLHVLLLLLLSAAIVVVVVAVVVSVACVVIWIIVIRIMSQFILHPYRLPAGTEVPKLNPTSTVVSRVSGLWLHKPKT